MGGTDLKQQEQRLEQEMRPPKRRCYSSVSQS